MAEWDAQTVRLWRRYLSASVGIGASADHEPEHIHSAFDAAEVTAAELREHLDRIGTPLPDVLADPRTRPRLLALAETVAVSPEALEWALEGLPTDATEPAVD